MIAGWLVKLVLTILIVGLLAVEAGSPLVARAQLDSVAHDAADSAAFDLLDQNDLVKARQVAQDIADDEGVVLETFTVDQRGVRVTVAKRAWSLVLKNWDRTEGWYDVRVTATASTVRG